MKAEQQSNAARTVDFSEIRSILKQEPRERLTRQIQTLQNYFKNNTFIKTETQRNMKDPDVIQSLFRNMRLEEWPKQHKVFSYGDRGELFYIIIQGQVSIRTPQPVELEAENTSAEGLISFLISYFEDMFWEQIENGERMKKAILDEFKRQDLDILKD